MFIPFQLQLILQTSEFAYCSNNSVLKIKPHYTHAQELFPFGEIILQFHFLIVYNYLMFGLKERKKKSQSISFHRYRPSQRRKSINARNSLQEMKYVSFCLLAK